jgi:dihydrofolate reductase
MSKLSIIVAIADDYAIGCANKLPWHLPADLKHFKNLTTGHAVIMGRKTFESLPNGALPNRKNIVLRSRLSDEIPSTYFEATSLDDALEIAKNDEKIFIIGGSTVYEQCLDRADSMYITWIHAKFEADTFFPKIDFTKWKEISRIDHKADERNLCDYSFAEYVRI